MNQIYAFIGPHLTLEDFYSLKKKFDSVSMDLKSKKKLVTIVEYGGPPYNFRNMSAKVRTSDKLLKEVFDIQRKFILETLNSYIKTRKGHPNVISSPFFEKMINLLLDHGAELVLEDFSFENYKKCLREYYDVWESNMSRLMITAMVTGKEQEIDFDPMEPHLKFANERDSELLNLIKQLFQKYKDCTLIIIRGSFHKPLVDSLVKEGYDIRLFEYE